MEDFMLNTELPIDHSKLFFSTYDFDVQLRQLLFNYCTKAEIFFKSNVSNALSLKIGADMNCIYHKNMPQAAYFH